MKASAKSGTFHYRMLIRDFRYTKDVMDSITDTQLCVIGRALTEVPEPYRTALHTIVETLWIDGGFTDDEAAFRMREAGLKSSATSIRRHRRGHCSCR